MKYLAAACILVMVLFMGAKRQALADTPTPTPTRTATFTNQQRADLSTLVPPPSCGSIYTPCGNLPWAIPIFATLSLPSPTINVVPSVYANLSIVTSTGTITPTATRTSIVDTSGLTTLVSGVSNFSSTTIALSTQSVEVSGTPQDLASITDRLGTMGNVGSAVGTMRGVVQATASSRTLGIVGFIFLCLVFVILVKLSTMFFAPLVRLIQFALHVIQTFKPF